MRTGITRDEAALMVALLAGAADGVAGLAEEQVILARLGPQLQRLGPEGQRRAVGLLQTMIAKAGLDGALSSIRGAMPVPTDRRDALADALAVVFSDGHLAQEEAERVARIARGLGLSEAELRHALASVRGASEGQAR